MPIPIDVDYARQLDRQDVLARFRGEFVIDDPDVIYLDGNSLGRLPRRCIGRMHDAIDRQWGERLIRAWGDDWFGAPQRIGAKIAQLLGAAADEVIVADSTSVNLFKLVMAALQARPGRTRVVTDELNFPSDLYVLRGALRLAGADYRLEVARADDGMSVSVDALAGLIDEGTALLTLSHTAFKSGYVHDMAEVTELAHRAGALSRRHVLYDVVLVRRILVDHGEGSIAVRRKGVAPNRILRNSFGNSLATKSSSFCASADPAVNSMPA